MYYIMYFIFFPPLLMVFAIPKNGDNNKKSAVTENISAMKHLKLLAKPTPLDDARKIHIKVDGHLAEKQKEQLNFLEAMTYKHDLIESMKSDKEMLTILPTDVSIAKNNTEKKKKHEKEVYYKNILNIDLKNYFNRPGYNAYSQKSHHRRRRGVNINIRDKTSNSNNTNVVQSILDRLKNGESQIKYANNQNIVMVLGNTGSGKSTSVQFIVGNNLSSVAVVNKAGGKTGKYIITDNLYKNKSTIGNSSIDSFTEIPDLVLDVETNTSVYDCPGFSDTRTAEHDIAGTFFTKKVTDIAKKIKFLLIVNYDSVQIGHDRTDFMRLVKHATSMIKNITKFKDSIAIVATKVSYHELDDEIINTITAFLEEVKQGLINKKDASLFNSIQLVNALLTTKVIENKTEYPRIGFFHTPNKAGLLSNMKLFEDNKNYLRNLLHENIKYTEHDNADDFGYTISGESQIYVLDLAKEIKTKISSCTADIANSVQEYYRDLVQKIANEINLFLSNSNTINANIIKAQSFFIDFNTGYELISNFIKQIKNITSAKELSREISSTFNFINPDKLQNKVSFISQQGQYLEFFGNVSVSNSTFFGLDISTDPFQSIIIDLNESKNRINENITGIEFQLKNKIKDDINYIANLIQDYYRDIIQKMLKEINQFLSNSNTINANINKAQLFFTDFNTGYELISNFVKQAKNVTSSEELLKKMSSSFNFINPDILQNKVLLISQQKQYLEFFGNVSGSNLTNFGLDISIDPFQNIKTDLSESKNRINENITGIELQLKNKIIYNINNIGTKIIKYFSHKEELSYDIENLLYDTESTYYKLLKIQQTANDINKIDICIQTISDNIYELNITEKDIVLPHYILSNAVKNGIYLQFLYALSGKSKTHSFRCADSLDNVIQYLDNSKRLYHFLNNLYDRLSQYDIQLKTKICYDLLSNVTQQNKSEKVVDIISQQFMNECNPEYKNNLKDITLDKSQLLILNKVLGSTLRSNIDISRDSQSRKLVVKGQYVKLKDIVKHTSDTLLDSVHIFALEKIFIDTDWNDPSIKEIIIISPIWDIQDASKIVLDGNPGEAHQTQKAENGIGNATKGEPGKPGLPGSPGRNFLGISKKVYNARILTISANGGQGGPGQSGGDGGRGYDGITATDNLNLIEIEPGAFSNLINGRLIKSCQIFHCKRTEIPMEWSWNPFKPSYGGNEFIFYGSNGGLGGDGGDGGIGGYGGQAGNIIFLSDSTTQINKSTNKGADGPSGQGGDIGKNGTFGKNLHIHLESKGYVNQHTAGGFEIIKNHYSPAQHDAGPKQNSPGKLGENSAGIMIPDNSVEFINIFYPLNSYKSYLRKNLIDNVRKTALRDFLYLLESNEPKSSFISNSYDTLGFLDEFQSLEQQFFELHKKISFLPFYESLLNRVNHYKERMLNNTNNKQCQTLQYLVATCFSKIHGIKNDPEKNLVVNVAGYFESVKKHITLYKNELKQVKINEHNENYQKIIQNRIDEASDLIKNDIVPEIYDILKETNENIMRLVNETINQIDIARSEKKEIVEKKRKLKQLMFTKTILSGIEIASSALALAGPVGAAIGGGTALVTGVVGSGIDSEIGKNTRTQITSIPVSVSKPIANVIDLLKIKKQIFQEQLHNVMKEFKNFSNDSTFMPDIKNEINNIQVKVNTLTPNDIARNSSFVKIINTFHKELVTSLDKKQKNLETEKSKNQKKGNTQGNKNIDTKLKVLQASKKCLSIAEKLMNSYESHEKNGNQIKDFDNDIRKVDEKIDKLKKYEENIYNIIIPMIQFIEKYFTETNKNLKGKSHMALDVSKWKMQSTLRDVQIQIREMTQGFDGQVSLTRCIEKFEFGVVTVIQMYDRIQDAYEKNQLTKYIADINSEVKTNSDREHENVINKLDLILRSNLVLNEYVHAMNAFEQDIFPFADMYLGQFDMNHTNINLTDMVDEAVRKITELSNTVIKHSTVVNPDIDNNFHRKAVFHSNFKGPGSFFLWKHDIYHEEISKLLKGQTITIKADIKNGIKHNAVKFNEIGLQFNLLDTNLQQQQLNAQLEFFTVKMTHLGDSYYKCGNRFYIITHDQQMINHHVTLESGTYANENSVYTKIKENPPILSPYTMWKIQLQHATDGNFEKLAEFANQSIDLELVGKGQYVDIKDTVCDNNLAKYYKVADIPSTIN